MDFIRLAKALLVATALVGASGCASMTLNAYREAGASPGVEVRSRNASLDGFYAGNVEKGKISHARIVVRGPRAACDDQTPVELLLPLSADQSAHPILKEAAKADAAAGKPVTLRLDVDDEEKAVELKKAGSWPGYPETVIFRHEMEGPPTVLYRFGPGSSDLRDEGVESDLKWVCRSRAAYVGSTILLPFAVLFDIVTYPVQLMFATWGD